MFAERPNRMSPFGALRSVGSLGQSVGLSRDELEVYVSNYATLQIARAVRSSLAEKFGPAVDLTLGSVPEISGDCRSLYFVIAQTAVATPWPLYVAKC
jgi:hypothetical protein